MGKPMRIPAVCNELCYTLSVVAALAAFLKTDHRRALLLEDDVCATTVSCCCIPMPLASALPMPIRVACAHTWACHATNLMTHLTQALLSPSTRRDLDWMSARPAAWDLVKLGDCYRGGKAFLGVQGDAASQSAVNLATGTCISRDQRLLDELSGRSAPSLANNNTLMPWLPLAYCTHAIAVSRRMAEHLIRQALPASDVFDSLLISHIARQAALRRRLDPYSQEQPALKLWSFNRSLFAQVAKVLPNNILDPSLRSYERSLSGIGIARARARGYGRLYRGGRR